MKTISKNGENIYDKNNPAKTDGGADFSDNNILYNYPAFNNNSEVFCEEE